MAILAGFSAAALPVVFLRGADEHPAAYAVYALSAYALTVVCIFLVRTLPGFYRAARQKLYVNPWGKRFMTDAAFRVWMSLLVSLGMNLVYSAFKLTVGIVYSSFWWGAVAVYYIVLSMIRFLLLCQMRSMRSQQDIMSEYRRYRLCGAMLVLLNLSLTGLGVQMVRDHRAYVYPESMVIASAAYILYSRGLHSGYGQIPGIQKSYFISGQNHPLLRLPWCLFCPWRLLCWLSTAAEKASAGP